MLSLRIVVAPGASAWRMPASSHSRITSDRIVSGRTFRTATLLLVIWCRSGHAVGCSQGDFSCGLRERSRRALEFHRLGHGHAHGHAHAHHGPASRAAPRGRALWIALVLTLGFAGV